MIAQVRTNFLPLRLSPAHRYVTPSILVNSGFGVLKMEQQSAGSDLTTATCKMARASFTLLLTAPLRKPSLWSRATQTAGSKASTTPRVAKNTMARTAMRSAGMDCSTTTSAASLARSFKKEQKVEELAAPTSSWPPFKILLSRQHSLIATYSLLTAAISFIFTASCFRVPLQRLQLAFYREKGRVKFAKIGF